MFATWMKGSEGAPLVGEPKKGNRRHQLRKWSLWQRSGWSPTPIKIVPRNGQCGIT